MVEIKIDGQKFGFWQFVSIRDSVDDMCSTVRLGIGAPQTGLPLDINANTVIEVLVDGVLATTVRADQFSRHVEPDNHQVGIEARSLARELVDSQYSMTLSGLTLGDIVTKICSTFGVPCAVDGVTTLVPDFSTQCEAPANSLINAARTAGMLLYPDLSGGVILTAPASSAPVATLVYGQHFSSYNVVDEYRLRFSEYCVKSYDYGSNASLAGTAKDDGITFFRPMHMIGDRTSQALGACDRRALLERNRRLARAHRVELDVVGWTSPAGLWSVNTQVRVVIPPEGIDDVFLIGEREFSLDDHSGSITRLMVMPRNAFVGSVAPAVAKHSKAWSGK